MDSIIDNGLLDSCDFHFALKYYILSQFTVMYCELWLGYIDPRPIASVLSVSVWFLSKERPRNRIFGFGRARNGTRAKKWKREALLFARFLTLVSRRTETLATRPTVPQRNVSVHYTTDLSMDYPVYGPTVKHSLWNDKRKNLGVVKIAVCASFLSLLLVNL